LSKNQEKKNKILILGPPASGKTTIKEAFFKYVNPLSLSNLEPTRGVISEELSILDSNIGLFDVSGQELQSLMDNKDEIFRFTDVFILVFDVTIKVDIFSEIYKKFIEIRNSTCPDSIIYLIIHKIDILNESDLFKKYRTFITYFETIENKANRPFRIYRTSIMKEHFFNSYNKMESIIRSILNKNIIRIDIETYNSLKFAMDLILVIEPKKSLRMSQIKKKLGISESDITENCNKLVDFGFLEEPRVDKASQEGYQLTEYGRFIQSSINEYQKEIIDKNEQEIGIKEFIAEIKLEVIMPEFIDKRNEEIKKNFEKKQEVFSYLCEKLMNKNKIKPKNELEF
jgi:GTPase SAR1 family protein